MATQEAQERIDDSTPQGLVRKWVAELTIAEKAQKDWMEEGQQVYDLYESQSQQASNYNILWSNTEVLRPAIYNSTPVPDCRRRFRDQDVLGKAVAQVMERALSYSFDIYDFDGGMQAAVLDCLLPGRGVKRVRYVPKFAPLPTAAPLAQEIANPASGLPADVPATAVPQPATTGLPLMPEQGMSAPPPISQVAPTPGEMVYDQQALCEHVQWKNFRHGPGKTWSEVPWVAFDHDLSFDELVSMFGEEVARTVPLADVDPDMKVGDKQVTEMFRTAKVHEIWDKSTGSVLFIHKQKADAPCLAVPDPLRLQGFFCCPRPLYAIENSTKLTPTPLYRLYKQQAAALNKISRRIDVITEAMKVRGMYAANISEVASLLASGDNDMTPIANVTEIAAAGGLDKAIWIMPVEKLIVVLTGLYQAREQLKQAIYELTGISDIVRGSTDPNETKGAQVLKSQWGTLRLQRLQREVQRFARDLVRMTGEIIAQQFSQQQLAAITGLEFPTAEEKMQAQQQMELAQMPQVHPMTGQPMAPQVPPPELLEILEKPTWEEIMAVLQSDEMRQYKVDVETDSTVAETVDRDMKGLSEILGALGQFIQTVAPLVQSGVMPIEAAREIALAIVRRAKLGSAVEDQISQIGNQQQQMGMQQQQADGMNQILQAIQQLGQQGNDLGNGVQNGLQQISNQIQVALENVGRQQQPQLRAV